MKLWHCHNARSLRPLWALEEMGLEYELEVLPFPPRVFQKTYLGTNVLGTVPYFVDGDTHMTESSGVCHYLVEKYERYDFGLRPDHPGVRRLPQLALPQRRDADLSPRPWCCATRGSNRRSAGSPRWPPTIASGTSRACASPTGA